MRPIVLILLLALALRLGWGLSRPADPAGLAALPDQMEYLALGRSILDGNGLVMTDPRFQTPVYAFRTPGYPAFVAACLGNVTVVRVAQAIVDTGTVLGVFLITRRLVRGSGVDPPLAPLAAAEFVAVCPWMVYFSGMLLTETLFTAMLVWSVYLLISGGTARFLVGTLVLALAVLVRPGAMGLPLLLPGLAAMMGTRLPRTPVMLSAVLLTGAVLLPWGYRNQVVLNEWVFTSTNGGITAYDGFNPAADGSSDQGAFLPHLPHLGSLTETQRNHHLYDLAAEYRSEHPERLLPLSASKILRTWSPVPLGEGHRSAVYWGVSGAYCAVVWGLAVYGFRRFRGPEARGLKVLVAATAMYLTLGVVLTVGSLRYRVPVEPLIAIVAGLGVSAWVRRGTAVRPVVGDAAGTARGGNVG
jgi:hypothetical protein